MAVVGVLMIGAGVFLMYEAYKSKSPTPITKATQSIKSAGAAPTPTQTATTAVQTTFGGVF